jgi:hypothetical protein
MAKDRPNNRKKSQDTNEHCDAESEEQRENLWTEHFTKLLSPSTPTLPKKSIVHDNVFPDLQLKYNTNHFTISKFESAVKKLCNNKAPRIDKIKNEILKLHELHPLILEFINNVYTENTVPNKWRIFILVPIHKKRKHLAIQATTEASPSCPHAPNCTTERFSNDSEKSLNHISDATKTDSDH